MTSKLSFHASNSKFWYRFCSETIAYNRYGSLLDQVSQHTVELRFSPLFELRTLRAPTLRQQLSYVVELARKNAAFGGRTHGSFCWMAASIKTWCVVFACGFLGCGFSWEVFLYPLWMIPGMSCPSFCRKKVSIKWVAGHKNSIKCINQIFL